MKCLTHNYKFEAILIVDFLNFIKKYDHRHIGAIWCPILQFFWWGGLICNLATPWSFGETRKLSSFSPFLVHRPRWIIILNNGLYPYNCSLQTTGTILPWRYRYRLWSHCAHDLGPVHCRNALRCPFRSYTTLSCSCALFGIGRHRRCRGSRMVPTAIIAKQTTDGPRCVRRSSVKPVLRVATGCRNKQNAAVR